jgi:hypothetical protein
LRPVPAIAVVGLTAISIAVVQFSPWRFLNPVNNASIAISSLGDLLVPSMREQARDDALAELRDTYRLDRRTLELIGDRPVHVDPWETNIVWAYGLDWRPLPIFQSNWASTPALDDVNADATASAEGPVLILRHLHGAVNDPAGLDDPGPDTIFGRLDAWEGPGSKLEMLCHFRPLRTTARFQLLERTADRCGDPRIIGSESTSYEGTVEVPRAPRGEAVIARIHGARPSGLERLRSFLFRPGERYVVLDESKLYVLDPATADDQLIVRVPRKRDFPPPFALAPDARAIFLNREAGWLISGGDDLRVDFYAVPLLNSG